MAIQILNPKAKKAMALFFATNILVQSVFPTIGYALTGGPSQPEVETFTPIGVDQMVNPFTGDFSYNLPLMNIPGPNGGYPLNLGYNAGIGMEQEASWVGLGWNLNPGAVQRHKRGLPDDLKGQDIKKTYRVKDNITDYISKGTTVKELFGLKFGKKKKKPKPKKTLNFDANINSSTMFYHNSYRGYGFANTFGAGLGLNVHSKKGQFAGSVNTEFSYTNDSQKGITIKSPFMKGKGGLFNSVVYNSHQGLQSFTPGFSWSFQWKKDILRKKGTSPKGKAFFSLTPSTGGDFGTSRSVSRSYNPYYKHNFKTNTSSYKLEYGKYKWGVYLGSDAEIGNIETRIDGAIKNVSGYGLMYTNNSSAEHVLDISRSQEISLARDLKQLPSSYLTYDNYVVNGQGVNSTFRAYPSRTIAYHSAKATLTTDHDGWGLQFGKSKEGNYKLGIDVSWGSGDGSSGKLPIMAELNNGSYNSGAAQSIYAYTPYYFANTAEMTSSPIEAIDDIFRNDDLPKYDFDWSKSNNGYIGLDDIEAKVIPNISDVIAAKYNSPDYENRNPQSENFDVNTSADAIPDWMELYGINSFPREEETTTNPTYPDLNGSVKSIQSVNAEGFIYEYGLTALVKGEKEVVAAVGNRHNDSIYNELTEMNSTLASTSNNYGRDNFISINEMPDYAHAYMLTAIYSPDYVDLLGDGPTEDDLGYYVKFNYSKLENYQFRSPYVQANFMRGLYSDRDDNKASYFYGRKDIYYVNSIETKTHIAEFTLGDRKDARGASGEFANAPAPLSGTALKRLERIDLYSKKDDNYTSGQPTPVKSIHFEYDYSLCTGVPNNIEGSGKLTLKKVFFTYKNSTKGKLSPYVFDYGINPSYAKRAMDRWGFYQPELTDVSGNKLNLNDENPYVNQQADYTARDLNAGAWSLERITFPSGGKLDIEYEADKYKYVQDKQAMQMFQLMDDPNNAETSPYTSGSTQLKKDSKLFFRFNKEIEDESEASEYVRNCFLPFISNNYNPDKEVFFKAFMELDPKKHISGDYDYEDYKRDYIRGYSQLEGLTYGVDYGVELDQANDVYVGWVKFAKANLEEEGTEVHSFVKAAIQHVRYERADMNDVASNALDFKTMKNQQAENKEILAMGYEEWAYTTKDYGRGLCFSVKAQPSFIRLYSPEDGKYGGGYRINQIRISDEWQTISGVAGVADRSYGTMYEYTDASGDCSGVASYEPIVGGEESPFRIPIKSSRNRFMILDESLYIEKPMMESYYPGAVVGYSRVVAKSLNHLDETIHDRAKSAVTVSEFYTAKDFPVREENTVLQQDVDNRKFYLTDNEMNSTWETVFNIFRIPYLLYKVHEFGMMGQSYKVYTNDMHGRTKSSAVYRSIGDYNAPNTQPVSYTETLYHTDGDYIEGKVNRLSSTVKAVHQGELADEVYLGKTVNSHFDSQENLDQSYKVSLEMNIEFIKPFPIPIPLIYPEESGAVSGWTTFTKHVNQNGIIKGQRSVFKGKETSTENLVYDGANGQPLITAISTNYNDTVYSQQTPGYYVYDQLGAESLTNGMVFPSLTIIPGEGTIEHQQRVNRHYYLLAKCLNIGDKVLYNGEERWVSEKKYLGTASGLNIAGSTYHWEYKLMFEDGTEDGIYNPNLGLAILDPIRENRLNVSVGSIAAFSNLETEQERKKNIIEAILNGDPAVYYDCDNTEQDIIPGIATYSKSGNVITVSEGGDYTFKLTVPDDYAMEAFLASDWSDIEFNYLYGDKVVLSDKGKQLYVLTDLSIEAQGAEMESCGEVLASNAMIMKSDWLMDYDDLTETPQIDDGASGEMDLTNTQNPYRYGRAAVTRPYKSYVWKGDVKGDGLLQEKGVYTNDFETFDYYSAANGDYDANTKNWVLANEITQYNPYGFELENVDPLGIYSSEIFGYDQSLVTAVGANVKYKELCYDGYEDYPEVPIEFNHGHIKWNETENSETDLQMSLVDRPHTGEKSLRIGIDFPGIEDPCEEDDYPAWTLNYGLVDLDYDGTPMPFGGVNNDPEETGDDTNGGTIKGNPFPVVVEPDPCTSTLSSLEIPSGARIAHIDIPILQDAAVVPGSIEAQQNPYMILEKGKQYVISYWEVSDYQNYYIGMVDMNSTTPYSWYPNPMMTALEDGIDVEGKKRRNFLVTIDKNFEDPKLSFGFVFLESPEEAEVVIDDIRIHPFNGEIKTFAYDPHSLKLKANLDDQNFATIYNYDEEGKLIQVKRETRDGIVTLKSSRKNKRNNPNL